MASREDEEIREELLPLRQAAREPDALPEDRLLWRGLDALYAGAALPPPSEEGWSALSEEAARCARRARRRYLLGELIASALPSRVVLHVAFAAGLFLLLFHGGDRQITRREPVRAPVLLSTARASLQGGTVQLLDGAELKLHHGNLDVDQADQARTRVMLRKGRVSLTVPRLAGPRRLTVTTSDAEVIVHGTQFDVSKEDASSTLVAVQEGLVEVRPQGGGRPAAFLRPGERLSVPSLSAYRAEISRKLAEMVHTLDCTDADRVVDTYLRVTTSGSDVSAALYLMGACSARRGEIDEAVSFFERAASSSSDLLRADNALARAAQLRTTLDQAEGAAAWQRYLQRFPSGLHRDMARRYLAQRHRAQRR